jgi:hypothetical protein
VTAAVEVLRARVDNARIVPDFKHDVKSLVYAFSRTIEHVRDVNKMRGDRELLAFWMEFEEDKRIMPIMLGAALATAAASCANYTAYVRCVTQTYPICVDSFQSGVLDLAASFNCTDASVVSMLNMINCGSICQVTQLTGDGGGGSGVSSALAAWTVLGVCRCCT